MKKGIRYLGLAAIAVAACAGTTSCGSDNGITVGMVCIGNTETSTYDRNFRMGLEQAAVNLGLNANQLRFYEEKGEGDAAKQAAIDAAEDGCDIVIMNSYGHQFFADAVAQMYPEVQFVACTGDLAHTQKIPNLCNAFASIYEGRYLAGIAAGMYLKKTYSDPADHLLGYIAAWPYAEVISGYTAFYLGAKSVCDDVKMKYTITSSWGDFTKEKTAAEALIAAGCRVISQHADTYGAPTACESAGVPNISYNVATDDECPKTYLCSSRIDWAPYFQYLIETVEAGETVPYDWAGGFADGSVAIGNLGTCAVEGTQDAMDEAAQAFFDGELHVFDCSKFTVNDDWNNPESYIKFSAKIDEQGHITSYMADVDSDPNYTGDTEVVADGYFHESEKRSAPYFNIAIDGISVLANK